MAWGSTYWTNRAAGSVNNPVGDCTYLKERREESPFAARGGKKCKEKLDYCRRQIKVLKGWCIGKNKAARQQWEIEVERWNQRMYLIEKGKL